MLLRKILCVKTNPATHLRQKLIQTRSYCGLRVPAPWSSSRSFRSSATKKHARICQTCTPTSPSRTHATRALCLGSHWLKIRSSPQNTRTFTKVLPRQGHHSVSCLGQDGHTRSLETHRHDTPLFTPSCHNITPTSMSCTISLSCPIYRID